MIKEEARDISGEGRGLQRGVGEKVAGRAEESDGEGRGRVRVEVDMARKKRSRARGLTRSDERKKTAS